MFKKGSGMKFRILFTALLMAQSSAYASEALTGCAGDCSPP
ncbi:hypothetical protein RABR111495_16465 [Rahnella bruchi]|jgi:hypothetical protein